MLFNSYVFIFLFLPLTLMVYFASAALGRRVRLAVLLIASTIFYGWWDVRFLSLLLLSILCNYAIGQALSAAAREGRAHQSKILLTAGVTLNLGVLAVFKYMNFFIQNFDLLTGTHHELAQIILPLGISFFTFEQIGYLVDIKRGHIYRAEFLSYAVFVSFFPRLVAGPILRYSEIEPQVTSDRGTKASAENLAIGLTIFFIGLFKKAFLADGIAPHVAPTFLAASGNGSIDFFLAWGGALAYACQLYFDFSGYSDMAIGAARCFGITFPVNFDSPYKAASIIEFWRRWHVTLSRFLRDYLYFSLGGNRRGPARRYVNLMITMLLGGLWHGANWTFVCWGGLHGLYLIVNHSWNALCRNGPALRRFQEGVAWRAASHVLTFGAVLVAWVFFRAPNFPAAAHVLEGMAGLGGASLPNALLRLLAPAKGPLAFVGVTFGASSGSALIYTFGWVTALLLIAFLAPNTQQVMARFDPSLPADTEQRNSALRGRWSFSLRWALAAGAFAFMGVIAITHRSEFLYWQF